MAGKQPLDFAAAVHVTDDDREALRKLRSQTPSWLNWDWRTLLELVPAAALRDRPTASASWQPFQLD